MDVNRRLFLSAASAEFRPLRGRLDAILSRSGFNCEFQEIFPQSAADTLRKLSDLVRPCGLLLHIVGHQPGSVADPQAVLDLLDGIPADQFLPRHPDLRRALGDLSGITYTQWEAFLALHHGVPLFVYAPADALEKGRPRDTFAQKTHLDRLLLARKYPEPCEGEADFLSKIPSDVYRHCGVQPPAEKPIHLPYPTLGTLFKGRESFLAELRTSLAAQHPTVIRGAQAIHGMGGVGKTRAAVEYAWAHADDYTALLFVTADSPDSLLRNLAALAGPLVLDLPEKDAPETALQADAVLRWLQQHPGWFLILDNADDPPAQRAVADLLTKLPRGHVVITSRLADWPAGVTPLDLHVLSPESSLAFLLERTHDRRLPRADDPATAAAIALQLDHLALALEAAAAYIRARRCSFADYLHDWESKRPQVLSWHDPEKSHYPRSIAITYETSLAQLTDDARTLFRRLSWLAADPLPVQHLEKIKDLPDPRALLIALTDLHLATLSPNGASFTIHRLLQEITRQQQPEEKPAALLSALSWVNGLFLGNPTNPDTWPLLSPLAPHATALAHFADARHIITPTARLSNRLGLFYKTKAQHQTAEPLYRRAVDLWENKGGTPAPGYPTALGNLAQLLKATNRLAEAEPLMRRALALDEASLGKDHPKVAIRLNNLAQLLHDTNRLAEAEPLMRRALAIGETTLGKDHPEVATDLNILAQLLHDTNRLAEAEPLIRRALDIDEASFGKDHPNVATDLNNLAQLLHDTNRFEEAEPLMRRALAIGEASLGKDHPDVAIRLNNLAQLLQATSRLAEADPLMRRALEMAVSFQISTGHESPSLKLRTENYRVLLAEMGDPEAVIEEKLGQLLAPLRRK